MSRKIIAILLAVTFMLTQFAVFAEEDDTTFELNVVTENDEAETFKYLMRYIKENYNYEVSDEELINGAFKGMLDVLDKHSKYFSKEEYDDFVSSLNGGLIGIGVFIENENGNIKVLSPIEGSPAYYAGIKAGDIIIKVDDTFVKDTSYVDAINRIRGEEGSQVTIIVQRGSAQIKFEMTREKIKVPDVTYEMLEDNIAYLKITQFGLNVSKEFAKAIEELQSKGMTSLIVDLRNNPGGYLPEVIDIADFFVDEGDEIVHIDYRNYTDISHYAEKPALNIPTVVLINSASASASEILAGAIQNNDVGEIVGVKSYGKGTVQTLSRLEDGTGLKLTVAEYFTAGKVKINEVGITPDYMIQKIDSDEQKTFNTFAPMVDDELAYFGTRGLDVYGAQQRLNYLGYEVNVTGIFDVSTTQALQAFQEDKNLKQRFAVYPETKEALNNAINELVGDDAQLDKAIEVIKSLK